MESSGIFTVLLLTSVFLRSTKGQCPNHFMTIFDVCVNISSDRFSYCKAQQYCHSINGQLLFGDSFMKFNGKYFPEHPNNFWIGLTDLLEERNTSRSRWRWTDGSLTPNSTDIKWDANYPFGHDEGNDADCVIMKLLRGNLSRARERECIDSRYALCQPRSPTSPWGYFQSVSSTRAISGFEFGKGHCTDTHFGIVSEIDCARQCLIEASGWCVSFHFHEQRKECVTVRFTDTAIQLTPSDNQWKKFHFVRQ